MLDDAKLKRLVIDVWRRGGADTLVKVFAAATVTDPARPVGYCTTLKYLVGRTPAQMERVIGLKAGTKLRLGAEIHLVTPLPGPGEFDLRGYTQLPGGRATNDPAYRHNDAYPPGLGAPQWDLARHAQSNLRRIAIVPPGVPFHYDVRSLPPQL